MKNVKAKKTATEEMLLLRGFQLRDGVFCAPAKTDFDAKTERNADAFSAKWEKLVKADDITGREQFQKDWYLRLYGFIDESELAEFLGRQEIILDAGAGYGFKSAYFASLSPETLVICMDLSDSMVLAAEKYRDLRNLVFVKSDIARTGLEVASVDFVNCDQVLHHTISPKATLKEFARILRPDGHAALYVYARKALPRELLDEHFISGHARISREDLWALSEKLAALGKMLEETGVELDFPEIPQLDIKGGKQSLQRFIYYNFIKCFWNAEMGFGASVSTNFDWYAPSIAYRYSKQDFEALTSEAGFQAIHYHSEPACHSGLFQKAAK